MLADEFLKIEKLEPEDRAGACAILYQFNPRFKQYADLCYEFDANISSEALPEINYDDAPLGLHPTSLEMVYKDFRAVVYNPDLDPMRSMQRFLQIAESISRGEVDFLVEIIDGGIIWFPYQDWEIMQPIVDEEDTNAV